LVGLSVLARGLEAHEKERGKPMRRFRSTALGAALLALALVAAACAEEEPGGGGGGGGGAGPIASQLTFGGPPECPERPFCIPGLKETYGIEFGDF